MNKVKHASLLCLDLVSILLIFLISLFESISLFLCIWEKLSAAQGVIQLTSVLFEL